MKRLSFAKEELITLSTADMIVYIEITKEFYV